MDKDLRNFKKWFKNLGLELDGKVEDDVLNKLIPPQRRDMWRNIIQHVLPKEEVELIKKSILLHKLQKRQTPLMAKVETDEDLPNALKYEELLTKYNKIQKEIIDTKNNNNKLKIGLNEKNECKKNLIKTIELKQNKCYVAKHKIESYNKLIKELNKISDVCNHFSMEANEDLTKTDYEDSLIKCLTVVDDAKQSGIMNSSINIGGKLCNAIYTTISDKSPAILLKTIKDNLHHHIDNSNKIMMKVKETAEHGNDDLNVFNELTEKLFQKQLELKSKLSSSLTKKGDITKILKETINMVENDFLNQYKLKYISSTEQEFLIFKKNLKETLQSVIKNSIDCSKIIGFQENISFEKETFKMLDTIFDKTNILNEEIDQKRIIICEMLKELNAEKSTFGLIELKSVMEKLSEDYLKKINNSNPVNETISSIKTSSSCDVDNINKVTHRFTHKSNVINFRNLQDIKHLSEVIDVIDGITPKFEQFNNSISAKNNFDEVIQKENLHKLEFDCIISQIENNILGLESSIEDCKLIADEELNQKLHKALSENDT